MRDKKNRLALQKVFVLGAGASFSASLTARGGAATTTPLDKDFCKRIVSLDFKRPKWIADSQGLLLKNWRDHLPFEDSGLEAAIIRHLSHLQFFAAIDKRRASKNALTAAEYVNHMAHLIAYVLKRAKENERAVLRELAGIVYPPSRSADDQYGANRIITFNYDTLLDDHLLNRFSPQALYFDKIKNEPGGPNRRSRYVAYPLLVKLHGSVNWRCSTDEFGRIVDTHSNNDNTCRIEEIWFDGTGTPSPQDSESPCIVPPMPNKPITRIELFRYLWSLACEYLHEAKELVICGYSLPETDSLAMSLFGQLQNEKLERITIVDPEPGILKRWRSLLIKGNHSARWEYHSDFAEYVQALKESPDYTGGRA